MSYISSLTIDCDKVNPFPFDIPSIKHAKNIALNQNVTFLIGDNGTGKSTLLETLAYRMHLPHIDGASYTKSSFEAARRLIEFLKIEWNINRSVGFFFRAEDFGDYLNSVDRVSENIYDTLRDLKGEVPDQVIQEMIDSANYQKHFMRKGYGQELQHFSHGEAYLHIMQEKIKERGIFLLDEPEAALSPSKQLSLIYFIKEHLSSNNSQFIIATHSPILMSFPDADIYEISENGMVKTALENTEHFSITKSFLNDPNAYFRHLM